MTSFSKAVRQFSLAVGSGGRALDRRYRSLLRDQGVPVALAGLSPLALLSPKSSVQGWLDRIREEGREAALADAPVSRLLSALLLFDSAAGPEVREAARPLQAAALSAATEAYLNVGRSELRTLERVLQIEATASETATMLADVLRPVQEHFGAVEVRLLQLPRGSNGTRLMTTAQIARAAASRLAARAGAGPWAETVRCVWSIPLDATADSVALGQLGFNTARSISERDRRLLDIICERCALAQARLRREQRIRERSLKLIEVEELERSRLSRELHDEPAQSLAVVRLHVEMIETGLPEDARVQLSEARAVLEKTILDVRRLISELSPPVLEQLGIAAAIRQQVVRFRRVYKGRVTLQMGKLPEIDHQYGLVLYRSLQECFANILKHSGAKNINVSLQAVDRVLRLHVEDDGVGFHVRETMSRARSFGLIGIRERVSLLGGQLTVTSAPNGGERNARMRGLGTRVDIELPLPEKNPS